MSLKKLFHDQQFIDKVSVAAGNFLNLWLRTCKYEIIGYHIVDLILHTGMPVIVTTWHCGLLPVLHFFKGNKCALMVSSSKDGEWIDKIVKKWGYATVRGSSGRGGHRAARKIIQYLQMGYHGGLIADGSRGPARKVQKGVVFLAAKTKIPLLPMGIAAYPSIKLPTWDKTIIPLPFSKIIITVGNPLYLSSSTDFFKEAGNITRTLNNLFEKAERLLIFNKLYRLNP